MAQHRIFEHPSGALFLSKAGRVIELHKLDHFRLVTKDGKTYGVRDGLGIPLSPEQLKDLRKKSVSVKPAADYKDRMLWLSKNRLDMVAHLKRYLPKSLDCGATEVQAWASMPTTDGQAFLQMTHNSAGCALYCKNRPDATQSEWKQLQKSAERLFDYLERRGIELSEPKVVRAHLGNMHMPTGKVFSGEVLSYLAHWEIKE